nr:ribonuclease H-like domain-containing protein [Tanacetum cinerariifolium]
MNKLVKGNLVRGLPSKLFENDQTCIACQKGKQHRASCKSKTVNSISLPLHLLHMDLFGLTFVKSLMKKMYCLVVTDDNSKSDGKADEGFLVGYSLNSKAFRVFNSRTRIVEENLHIRFSESTLNVVGSGPDWLFDIDALTRTMNYDPIIAGTQSNGFIDPKSSNDDGSKPLSDDGKKVDEDPRKENECNDQEKEDNVNRTNNVNTVSSTVNTAGINRVNVVVKNISIELQFDPNMPALEDVSTFDFLVMIKMMVQWPT